MRRLTPSVSHPFTYHPVRESCPWKRPLIHLPMDGRAPTIRGHRARSRPSCQIWRLVRTSPPHWVRGWRAGRRCSMATSGATRQVPQTDGSDSGVRVLTAALGVTFKPFVAPPTSHEPAHSRRRRSASRFSYRRAGDIRRNPRCVSPRSAAPARNVTGRRLPGLWQRRRFPYSGWRVA